MDSFSQSHKGSSQMAFCVVQTREDSPSNAFATFQTNTYIFTNMASLMGKKVIVLLEAFSTLARVSPQGGFSDVQ